MYLANAFTWFIRWQFTQWLLIILLHSLLYIAVAIVLVSDTTVKLLKPLWRKPL